MCMKWFGPVRFARLCDDCDRVIIPVGAPCEHCEELIAGSDAGFIIPVVESDGVRDGIYHRECHLRSIIGSVNHQLQLCSCFVPGATELDPPGLTKRQAARLAVELWEKEQLGTGTIQ